MVLAHDGERVRGIKVEPIGEDGNGVQHYGMQRKEVHDAVHCALLHEPTRVQQDASLLGMSQANGTGGSDA